MGMDLHNDRRGYFRCSGTRWRVYLELAKQFGWSATGTLPPVDHVGSWSGDYLQDSHQRVSESDAAALASAIERAISSPELESTFFRILARLGIVPTNDGEREYHWMGEREVLIELVEFCRCGEFEIR